MLSDSESNSFTNSSRISDQDIMEEDQEDVEESLTHKLTSRFDVTWRFDHTIQMPFLKVKELNALEKWTIFIAENSNFEIVYFERLIFILCGKQFRFIDTLKNDTNSWNLVEFPKLEVSPQK